jgi:flagellar protein FliS
VGNEQNPYQAYTDGSIYSDDPLNLVVALYQGALEATTQAENAVHARDILARTRAINKAVSILIELLVSLDLERGGEISQNLKRLYSYMQVQLLNANMRQVAEPIAEVSKLLTTLLEGWRGAQSSSVAPSSSREVAEVKSNSAREDYSDAPVYGGQLCDSFAASAYSAYSF